METFKTIEIKKFVDDQNIEYKLFLNDRNVPTVRVRDLDANENVSLVKYPSITMAEIAYEKALPKI
jgi:hypothetical protein